MTNLKNSNSLLIHANNISKSYHDGAQELLILHELNFKLSQGENIAILGASGSGKSTLLHILAGLDEPTSGEVFIDNHQINIQTEDERAKLRNKYLGFVYQFHHLLPEFTALENIAMPLLIRGEDFESAYDQANVYLKKVELTNRAKHKPSELSGGERQRIAIARALVANPKCILADEPTGNLDEDNAASIFNLFLQLNKEFNTAIVLVTHNQQLASMLDKTYLLNNGELIEQL